MGSPVAPERVTLFSLVPLAERLLTHSWSRGVDNAERNLEPTVEAESSAATELVTRFVQPLSPEAATDTTEDWRLMQAFHRLRENRKVGGLSHNMGNPDSFMALDYSDIFETGHAPYKGGHGISLFFRHDF